MKLSFGFTKQHLLKNMIEIHRDTRRSGQAINNIPNDQL